MISTLLVANRGEIALRVFRTASRLGIRTVAIHTDLDASAPHVRAADEAVRVGSYLDIDAVVEAARSVGADAVHPGYGFLSERAEFARALEAAGITLVGPSADVMEQMGRKDHARAIAERAGVPVVPRWDAGPDTAHREWQGPVLVKAAAGGGGKGMRVVRSEAELADAIASAKREAASAFGDDTMLIEKYVERGRHIEVQVMADTHGSVLHLHERDCSSQRRHQKVIEEAPAPTLTPQVRALVTSSAVALAREVGYVNAGTVEFLLDADTDEAYFLEMNTRLQVEHPVTEAITGLDLVELQLRIAAGEPLGMSQEDIRCEGHAMEARVYAEDAFGGFLPQAGTATMVSWPDDGRWPDGGAPARVDAALETGQTVTTSYDPMLGKVITSGPDRESARLALVEALDHTAILGFTTNVGFLRALAASAEFRDAAIDTAWLDHHEVAAPAADTPRLIAAWTQALLIEATTAAGPFRPDGFRLGGPSAPIRADLDTTVWVDRAGGRIGEHRVREQYAGNHVVRLEIDGVLHQAVVNIAPGRAEVVFEGQRFVLDPPDPFADRGPATGDGSLIAPMPGTVLAVSVAAGDLVEAGQTLGVIEAMKMELALKAPFAGTVVEVDAVVGKQVPLGAVLFVIESSEGSQG